MKIFIYTLFFCEPLQFENYTNFENKHSLVARMLAFWLHACLLFSKNFFFGNRSDYPLAECGKMQPNAAAASKSLVKNSVLFVIEIFWLRSNFIIYFFVGLVLQYFWSSYKCLEGHSEIAQLCHYNKIIIHFRSFAIYLIHWALKCREFLDDPTNDVFRLCNQVVLLWTRGLVAYSGRFYSKLQLLR